MLQEVLAWWPDLEFAESWHSFMFRAYDPARWKELEEGLEMDWKWASLRRLHPFDYIDGVERNPVG
jgi:hypothetical protein